MELGPAGGPGHPPEHLQVLQPGDPPHLGLVEDEALGGEVGEGQVELVGEEPGGAELQD